VPSDAAQARILATVARGQLAGETLGLHCLRLAVIHLDDAYGLAFAQALEEHFSAL